MADAPQAPLWEGRARRAVLIYLPLACFVFVLLFPFYWMAITAFKPNAELYNYKAHNPFLIAKPTLEHFYRLIFATDYPRWLLTTMAVAIGATLLSLTASALAAYAIARLRFPGSRVVGLAIYIGYLVPPAILFLPLSAMVYRLGLFDTPFALVLVYPTFLVPFCTWLLIGYFKSIPLELEDCARVDGATRLQALRWIVLPLAAPGLISAGIFSFTLSWNEFVYALAFIQSGEKKTVPVAMLTELVSGDVYQWGALMAGSLLGSLPVAILYGLFANHYVSALTGALNE
jgi:multiple sugar transport system permease protein